MTETTCQKCSVNIPVTDIYVSVGPYLVPREKLIKNLPRYMKFLQEAEREAFGESVRTEKGCAYDVTLDDVQCFATHLKEMLNGCRRSGVRHPLSGCNAEVRANGGLFTGSIKNVSITGVCVDAGAPAESAGLKTGLRLSLSMAEGTTGPRVDGEVVWVRDKAFGAKFVDADPMSVEAIKKFILQNSLTLNKKTSS